MHYILSIYLCVHKGICVLAFIPSFCRRRMGMGMKHDKKGMNDARERERLQVKTLGPHNLPTNPPEKRTVELAHINIIVQKIKAPESGEEKR